MRDSNIKSDIFKSSYANSSIKYVYGLTNQLKVSKQNKMQMYPINRDTNKMVKSQKDIKRFVLQITRKH